MRFGRHFVVFIAIVILQTTFCRLISIRGIQPDLALLFLLWLAMKEGALAGVYGGFAMGLIFDVYSPQTLGVGSLAKTITGYLAGFLDERNITLDDRFKPPVILIAALFHNALTAALVFDLPTVFHRMFLVEILPSALYTTAVGGLFLLLTHRRK